MKLARLPISTDLRGPPGLVRWLRTVHPRVYVALQERVGNTLGLVAPTDDPVATAAANPSTGQMIVNTIKDLSTVLLPLYQQNKLLDLQIKRAQQNLPLYDTAALADATSLRVGVDSATRNTGLWIAGGLGAVLLLGMLMRRRA